MKKIRILGRLLKQTGAGRMLIWFAVFFFVCAVIIWLCEPQIRTLGEALWYCYAVITTIGFGDVLVTSFLSRTVSVILSIYAALVLAIVTGVVVNFFNQIVQLKQKKTLTAVLDRLEQLPQMTREELEELSEDIRELRRDARDTQT